MSGKTIVRRQFQGKKRNLIILALCVAAALMYMALPIGMPNKNAYFEPIETRQLQKDEIGQLIRVRKMFAEMANKGDDFIGWNTDIQDFWKYTIAFSSYGIPSAMIIDPENEDEYRLLLDTMIWKMKSRRVWGDFTDRGFGTDPIGSQNIMYKGHLNLMYGLYQMTTGDTRYAKEFTWLTNKIAEEMRLHHEGSYEGVTCEPNAWFVECNTIGIMSLHIYDKLYGTTFIETEAKWTLDFMTSRMQDEETGLFYRSYHPQQDVVLKDISGYANAWSLSFLKSFLPVETQRIYDQGFRENLVLNYGPFYASVKGDLRSDPKQNQVAHIFGLWAAKEFDDANLFGKLRNSIDKIGSLQAKKDGGLGYKSDDSPLMNGVVLGAKLHLGWDVILSHDWGHPLPAIMPETDGITWEDLLPTEIYMSGTDNVSLPASRIDKRPCPNCFWGEYESIKMKKEKQNQAICLSHALENSRCGMKALQDTEFK